jgi:hypothetical protein
MDEEQTENFFRILISTRLTDDIVQFYIPVALLDFFPSYFINEVNFQHYKKYGSVGRFTIFGNYVFKSNLEYF